MNNLNSGETVCVVVGNRTVAGIQIPMDQITAAMLNKLGLIHSNDVRRISDKELPLTNSPTNISGRKGKTMTSEFIVVFHQA